MQMTIKYLCQLRLATGAEHRGRTEKRKQARLVNIRLRFAEIRQASSPSARSLALTAEEKEVGAHSHIDKLY
jgi:hypothetical protein